MIWKRRKLLGKDFARRWWRGEDRTQGEDPRGTVIVESPDAAEAHAYWRFLREEGYEVAWCPGPDARPHRRCALVASGRCEVVERSDVVVSALGMGSPSARGVVSAIRQCHPSKPLIVQAPQPKLERWASLVGTNSEALSMPVTRSNLLEAVEFALAKPERKVERPAEERH
jgi:hypothetical protein